MVRRRLTFVICTSSFSVTSYTSEAVTLRCFYVAIAIVASGVTKLPLLRHPLQGDAARLVRRRLAVVTCARSFSVTSYTRKEVALRRFYVGCCVGRHVIAIVASGATKFSLLRYPSRLLGYRECIEAFQQMWLGVRNEDVLCASSDDASCVIVRSVLRLVRSMERRLFSKQLRSLLDFSAALEKLHEVGAPIAVQSHVFPLLEQILAAVATVGESGEVEVYTIDPAQLSSDAVEAQVLQALFCSCLEAVGLSIVTDAAAVRPSSTQIRSKVTRAWRDDTPADELARAAAMLEYEREPTSLKALLLRLTITPTTAQRTTPSAQPPSSTPPTGNGNAPNHRSQPSTSPTHASPTSGTPHIVPDDHLQRPTSTAESHSDSDIDLGAVRRPSTFGKFDVFLSHDWGDDEVHRNNHERVVALSVLLKDAGFSTWCDADRMTGDIVSRTAYAIDNASVCICFITKAYMEKCETPDAVNDYCKKEFQ